jgi:hypothetical protein
MLKPTANAAPWQASFDVPLFAIDVLSPALQGQVPMTMSEIPSSFVRAASSSQIPIRSVLLFVLLSVQSGMGADLGGNDDFNDNAKDPLKWGPDISVGANTLTETQQRLWFSAAAVGAQDFAVRPWILNQASSSSDWEIVASAANTANPGLTDNQSCSFGVAVLSSASVSDFVYIGLYASTMGGPPLRRGFVSGLAHSTLDIAVADSHNIGVTAGAVRLLFNSRSKVITSYYDVGSNPEGYIWVKLGSFGVTGTNGQTGNIDWDLSRAQPFIVGIYGAATNMNVLGGTVSADDFSCTTAMTSPPALQLSRGGDQFALIWPRAALGFDLYERASMETGTWTLSPAPIVVNNSNVFLTNLLGPQSFYRLMHP